MRPRPRVVSWPGPAIQLIKKTPRKPTNPENDMHMLQAVVLQAVVLCGGLCAVGAAAFVPAPIPAAGLQRRPLAAFRCGMLVHQASCTTARAIKGTPRE